jgi:hypothetical protein
LLTLFSVAAAEPIPQIRVSGTVAVASRPLRPSDALPYVHALVQHVITVDRVVAGTLADQRIAILRWCVRDGAPVGSPLVVGATVDLVLEPWDKHPELAHLQIGAEAIEGDDFRLPAYLDMTTKPPVVLSLAPRARAELPAPVAAAAAAPPTAEERAARDRDAAALAGALDAEVAAHGGSYDAWAEALRPWRNEVVAIHRKQAYERPSGYKFFGRSMLASARDRFTTDGPDGDPVPMFRTLHQQLAQRGIDLLVVPIPTKEDILPDLLSSQAPADRQVAVPARRLMRALVEAGVEVLDLHVLFREHRATTGAALYLRYDTHWAPAAAQLAAEAIAARLQRYRFAQVARGLPPLWMATIVTGAADMDLMKGDPRWEELQRQFPWTYRAIRLPDGTPFVDGEASPVLLSGDSHSRQLIMDGGHLSAQLAFALNCPVSRVGREGGDGGIMAALAAENGKLLTGRRVVVWTGICWSLNKGRFPIVDLPRR